MKYTLKLHTIISDIRNSPKKICVLIGLKSCFYLQQNRQWVANFDIFAQNSTLRFTNFVKSVNCVTKTFVSNLPFSLLRAILDISQILSGITCQHSTNFDLVVAFFLLTTNCKLLLYPYFDSELFFQFYVLITVLDLPLFQFLSDDVWSDVITLCWRAEFLWIVILPR